LKVIKARFDSKGRIKCEHVQDSIADFSIQEVETAELMDTIILMLKLLLVDNCYAARMIIYTRTGILKLFSWCATICNLTHSMFHQLLFYVRSHGVSSILPPFLCTSSRQTLRYFDGMNSLVVRVHVVFVSGFYFFYYVYPLIFSY
jgi:hypothetical protein